VRQSPPHEPQGRACPTAVDTAGTADASAAPAKRAHDRGLRGCIPGPSLVSERGRVQRRINRPIASSATGIERGVRPAKRLRDPGWRGSAGSTLSEARNGRRACGSRGGVGIELHFAQDCVRFTGRQPLCDHELRRWRPPDPAGRAHRATRQRKAVADLAERFCGGRRQLWIRIVQQYRHPHHRRAGPAPAQAIRRARSACGRWSGQAPIQTAHRRPRRTPARARAAPGRSRGRQRAWPPVSWRHRGSGSVRTGRQSRRAAGRWPWRAANVASLRARPSSRRFSSAASLDASVPAAVMSRSSAASSDWSPE